ncbi:MAG TPA: MFS transporter [Usitatibacter sp.]|nr:MFS transporter [Usitatibacter sp.]
MTAPIVATHARAMSRPSTHRESAPPDSRRYVLAALMCTMMLAAMDTTIVSTAIPQIVGELGGFRKFSWVFSIYLLAQTVTIPIYGKLSDQFGRKAVLTTGTLIFLGGSIACALAWNMTTLIVFRGVQGPGAGAIMATVATLAGDLYSVGERAAVQGWFSSVWRMAVIAGPLLGGTFAEYASWRWIFVINLPIGAVSIALIRIFLKESFKPRHPRIDYAGCALVGVGGGGTADLRLAGRRPGVALALARELHRVRAHRFALDCDLPGRTPCRGTGDAGVAVAAARARGIEHRDAGHGARHDGAQRVPADLLVVGAGPGRHRRRIRAREHEHRMAGRLGALGAAVPAHRLSRHRIPGHRADRARERARASR